MPDESGFKLNEEFFPWPDHYDTGDTIIIERVTGLSMIEWAEELEQADPEGGRMSMSAMAGMMAAAMRQKHPGWKHRRIEELIYASNLGGEAFEIINTEPDEAEVVELPSPRGDESPPSEDSSPTSTDEPDSISDSIHPRPSGELTSAPHSA
jgi:hypothetical protein